MRRLIILILAFISAIGIGIFEYKEYYEDSYNIKNITDTIKDPLPSFPSFED
jgi:hypothetical protein